ncbi:MAG: hypothetical protein KC524_02445 [Gammaproteobacteria bacterium]|nr:hypothetical protein [Gammaproteobacteria bacterium]
MLLCLTLMGCNAADGPTKVEIVGVPGAYQLLRGGQPYRPRGAGAVVGSLESLKAHGANSIRTWHVGDGQILDDAQALGLSVSLCLDVGRERLGFDYNDEGAVAAQLHRFRQQVDRFKNHPALLTWIIGNELNLEAHNPKVWDAVNEIAEMIHEVDPNHPVTTALAGLGAQDVELLRSRAPALDFYSTQVYGGIMGLDRAMDALGLIEPLMVTEWGTVGHWEVPSTDWQAPIELTSAAKAAQYVAGYEQVIKANPGRIIGAYAFLWGQKQERTPTWYGTLMETGERTEAADALQYIWQGVWPRNRAPSVSLIRLAGETANQSVVGVAGMRLQADVVALDAENDALTYRWTVRPESQAKEIGGDPEVVPSPVPNLISLPSGAKVAVLMPPQPGAYRLFVEVLDDAGGVGHANLPFYVQGKD